jgi:predicted RNA-binding Zn ribbon-like protein
MGTHFIHNTLMPRASRALTRIGGRLAVDFANAAQDPAALNWEGLIGFLESTQIVSASRGAQLRNLPDSDPHAADALLHKSKKMAAALQQVFDAMIRKGKLAGQWIEPVNELLRVTEGHDELVAQPDGKWQMEFIAREGGLDWLLAAVARSAAEIISEGEKARLRVCANPSCGLFFCDKSRTRRRRWCSMATCGNRHKVASFAKKHAHKK